MPANLIYIYINKYHSELNMEKTAGFVMYSFHTGTSVFTGRNYKRYLDINTSCLLRFYSHISGVHYFY